LSARPSEGPASVPPAPPKRKRPPGNREGRKGKKKGQNQRKGSIVYPKDGQGSLRGPGESERKREKGWSAVLFSDRFMLQRKTPSMEGSKELPSFSTQRGEKGRPSSAAIARERIVQGPS